MLDTFLNIQEKADRITSAGHSSNTIVSRSQFKPILFSTDMVKAILSGDKTQTRRMVPEKIVDAYYDYDDWASSVGKPEGVACTRTYEKEYFMDRCKYSVGDILWVRETWRIIGWDFEDGEMMVEYKDGKRENVHYPCPNDDSDWMLNKVDEMESAGLIKPKADDEEMFEFTDKPVPWKPSIFMPKEACRLFLEVTDVRTEQIQSINNEDAVKEGVETLGFYPGYDVSSKGKFEGLWNKINGNESWDDNSWIYVVTFKVVGCPKGFC